jgi:hypothetical protein
MGDDGPQHAWVVATNVYAKTGARLAHGGAPRQPRVRAPSRPMRCWPRQTLLH